MTDNFENWINGMKEDMYIDWLEDTATEAQEEKALNIRQPLDREELAEYERMQEYEVESGSKHKEIEVRDNRDLPPTRHSVDIIIPPTGHAPIIIPSGTQPTTTIPIVANNNTIRQQSNIPPRMVKVSRTSRITGFFKRLNPFKRKNQ